MQDQNTVNSGSASSENETALLSKIEHIYLEVGKELLSKPNALCDLLEADGLPPTMVFCNSPSDADFVDVMLRKRGIASQKLIGFVPKQKLDQAILDFKTGALTVLVVTDIGARGIDQSNVDTVINYSIPADTDLYGQRSGLFKTKSEDEETDSEATSAQAPRLRRMISLISALDIGNFHYLRKAYEVNFVEGQVPQSEKINEGKYLQLKRLATEHAQNEATQNMVERIMKDGDLNKIIGLLVYNTLEVLPSLRAQIGKDEVRDDGDYEDDDDNIGQRGHLRNDRRDSRGDRGPRGRNDRDSRSQDRGPQRKSRNNRHDSEQDDGGYEDRQEREPRQRREQRPYVPPAKEVRLYVGSGTKDDFSKEKLVNLLTEKCELSEDSIKRFSSRPAYSFFDVAEEHADKIADTLGDTSGVFIKKAITLTAAREQQARDQEGHGDSEDNSSDQNNERENGYQDSDNFEEPTVAE
jgi:ATP-dependent RNA helicase DeaD